MSEQKQNESSMDELLRLMNTITEELEKQSKKLDELEERIDGLSKAKDADQK